MTFSSSVPPFSCIYFSISSDDFKTTKYSYASISFSLSNPTQKVQFMVAEPQGLYLKEVKY